MENMIYEVSVVDAVLLFFLLSMTTATVALTIAKSPVFKWLRKLLPKFELIHCPWCLGFWISGALILITGVYDDILWSIVFWIAMSGVAGLISGVIDHLYFWTARERDHWRQKYDDLVDAIPRDDN